MKNDLIPKSFMKNLKNRSVSSELDFVKKFSENDLKNFDF